MKNRLKSFILIIGIFGACTEKTPVQSSEEFNDRWGELNFKIEEIEKSISRTHMSSKEKIEELIGVQDSLANKANIIKKEMKQNYIALAEEIARLEIDFRDIKNVSDKFFEKAEEIVSKLEKRKNEYAPTAKVRLQERKREFYTIYFKIEGKIQELRGIYTNIDQIDLIVDFNIMLNQIDKAIEELNRINKTANKIVNQLKNLKAKGENVIKVQ
jgi:uncharacterized protein YkvS